MAVVFFIALYVSNIIINKGNTDMTSDMAPASLPIVYMNVNDEYINPLHGYTVEMEGNYLRGSITPLMANRSVSFKAELYEAVIAKVSYEVRPLDMSRLIEDTEVTDFTYENNEIYATANLKDLINDNEEYLLIIKLTTSSGNIIRYYTRVINRAELSIGEKIEFVRDFSGKTMNKTAAVDLKEYMESNREGDNSSYGYVNIHSNFKQLTWGELHPSIVTRKDLELIEIDEKSACVKLSYKVEIMSEIHNVTEYFRVQKGKDRMHLMEYERIMNQVFDEEKNVVVNGKILHGIVNKLPVRVENDNGTIYSFAQQDALFSYNRSTNTMARLFSFYDKDNYDERTTYDAHEIKPLTVDNIGNVKFLVYGYMNRGKHEGQTGVALYYYDAAVNTIEEMLFIPYYKSYQILKADIDKLAYVSPRDQLFILLDGSIYNININTRLVTVMQNSISEKSFFAADNESMIAWQKGENVRDYDEIQLYRIDSMKDTSIKASSGDIVVLLGFMDSDVIYGKARKDDITVDVTGRTLVPMYSVSIQDQNGNLLKEYKQQGVYILGISKQDNMIILNRVARDEETGRFDIIGEDQILNNKTETKMKNVLSSVVTEDTETTYQTLLYKENVGTLKLTRPKEVVYEGNKSIALVNEDNLTRYYVYSKGKLEDIYTDASDAVNAAESDYGVVVDKMMAYVFESGNRKGSVLLSGLDIDTEQVKKDPNAITSEDDKQGKDKENSAEGSDGEEQEEYVPTISSYARCLDVMLKAQGIYKDTNAQLRDKSVINVLKENLPKAKVLELSGCDMQAVLYYVSRGYPVMAMTENEGAVLIIGYDGNNTTIFDPTDEHIYKKGLNDSAAWFEQNGNRFISYVN